ncbi:MAG: hypothetical protein AAFZ07_05135 [Actinomycetota bacterium]
MRRLAVVVVFGVVVGLAVASSAGSAPVVGDDWQQVGLTFSTAERSDWQGGAVAMSGSGDSVIVGAWGRHGSARGSGGARVHDWDGDAWVQRGDDLDGPSSGAFAGSAVAMNAAGDVVAVGAPQASALARHGGQVQVLRWSGSAWVQVGEAIDGIRADAMLGGGVDLDDSGDTLAVSAIGHRWTQVYDWNGASWRPRGVALRGGADNAVALSADGGSVVIGDSARPSGTVRVHDWDGDRWEPRGATLGWDLGSYVAFGHSVAISAAGDSIAVGTPSAGAQVFDWRAGSWQRRGGILRDALRNPLSTGVGTAVALSDDGNTVAYAAPYGSAADPPTVSVARWNGAGWSSLGVSLQGGPTRYFGWAIALDADGDRLIVGAPSVVLGDAQVYRYVPPPALPGPSPTDPPITLPTPTWPGFP